MGGASSLPEKLSLDAVRQVAGDKFDQDKWDSAPKDEDGNISRTHFLELLNAGNNERRNTFGGSGILETYGSVMSRAIWRWKPQQVKDFFSEGMVDAHDEPITLSGAPSENLNGRDLVLGSMGLSPEDTAIVHEQLMHTAALFIGEIAMIEDDDERQKIMRVLKLEQDHVPCSWNEEKTIAMLDKHGISHPKAVGNGMHLYSNSWDMDDDTLDKLHHLLEKEAWLFMVDMAQKMGDDENRKEADDEEKE
jgi:hypothetical protein